MQNPVSWLLSSDVETRVITRRFAIDTQIETGIDAVLVWPHLRDSP